MNLEVDDSVLIVEGGELGICVTVSKTSHERERDIYISYSVLLHSNTSGNNILTNSFLQLKDYYYACAAINDYTIENMTNVIPPGESQACLQLLATDDKIVEDSEVFIVTIETGNTNDVVNGTTYITITDNDGMKLWCK